MKKNIKQTYKWRCGWEHICGNMHADNEYCQVEYKGKKGFNTPQEAARHALLTHPNHRCSTYVYGVKTGHVGAAEGLNFNG